jgi:hypothetical protein
MNLVYRIECIPIADGTYVPDEAFLAQVNAIAAQGWRIIHVGGKNAQDANRNLVREVWFIKA